jgi:uncharacterized protein (TIGR03435 family)
MLFVIAAAAAVAGQGPTFEVASVKPNNSGAAGGVIGTQPGGIKVVNISLRDIIRNVYQLQTFQLVGGPSWLDADRFDIIAKADGNPTQQDMLLMARALLAERFRLRVHHETRELPIYALVVSRADGKMGAAFRRSDIDCDIARRGGAPPVPAQPGARPTCGLRTLPGLIIGGGVNMPQLARNLSNSVGRFVVDRTGLAGGFDIDLTYTPDQLPLGPPPPGAPPLPPIDPNGPSIFTALQEQLGLKLESTRGPVEVLVVDSAERLIPD